MRLATESVPRHILIISIIAISIISLIGASPVRAIETALATPILGSLGRVVREATTRPDGCRHVDSPATISALLNANVNTYGFLVLSSCDWSDLVNEFLPLAQQNDLDVWVDLLPEASTPKNPDGTPNYPPHHHDYVSWAQAIASLSVTYPRLTGWMIDDWSHHLGTYTQTYMTQIQDAAHAINSSLAFAGLTYYWDFQNTNLQIPSRYGNLIEVFVFAYRDDPWINNHVTESLVPQLDEMVAGLSLYSADIILMPYAHPHANAPILPTASYVGDIVQTGLDYTADGKLLGVMPYLLHTASNDLGEAPSWRKARTGNSRLCLAVPYNSVATIAPGYAKMSRTVTVDPGNASYSLSFWQSEKQNLNGATGAPHDKHLLVDGQVVWQQDAGVIAPDSYQQIQVDVTAAVSGKSSVQISFRIGDTAPTTRQMIDWIIDDIAGVGVTVSDGGFETGAGWSSTRTTPSFLVARDTFNINRAAEILSTVTQQYANAT